MELPRSDVTHYFNGIAWITVAIIVGVVESATGFARVSFAIVFARRILRLVARGTLMFGLLKGYAVLAARLAVAPLTPFKQSRRSEKL